MLFRCTWTRNLLPPSADFVLSWVLVRLAWRESFCSCHSLHHFTLVQQPHHVLACDPIGGGDWQEVLKGLLSRVPLFACAIKSKILLFLEASREVLIALHVRYDSPLSIALNCEFHYRLEALRPQCLFVLSCCSFISYCLNTLNVDAYLLTRFSTTK